MESDKYMNPNEFIHPIGILNDTICHFSGTGFGYAKKGIVLTAKHVVNDTDKNSICLEVDGSFLKPKQVIKHPKADIAILIFNPDKIIIKNFECVSTPTNRSNFALGSEISSYGFPFVENSSSEQNKTLEPRLLSGTIQRNFKYEIGGIGYEAYELSFPAPVGLSGSPIFLKNNIFQAIGIVTANFDSSTIVDSYEEHHENGHTEKHIIKKVISYGVGLSLLMVSEWIQEELEKINI